MRDDWYSNALNIAIDMISEGKTPGQVPQVNGAIGDKGGKVAIINPYESYSYLQYPY